MLRLSLRSAARHLLRRPGTTLMHALGLAVGIACCFLALLYVHDELRTDRFHEGADEIVSVEQVVDFSGQSIRLLGVSSEALEALRTDVPGVVAVTATYANEGLIRRPDRPEGLPVEAVRFADASFFDVFTFPLQSGDPETALSRPNDAVLTEAFARRLFGTVDVIGRSVSVERTGVEGLDVQPTELTVRGVAETPPEASSLGFEMLVSGSTPVASSEGLRPALSGSTPTYVRLATLADTVGVHAVLEAVGPGVGPPGQETTVRLPLFVEQHFRNRTGGMEGNPLYLSLFSMIAGLVLVLACINYANLATALGATRATEVGVRKTLGAGRGQIAAQFLAEAGLLAVVAGVLAIGFTASLLPSFNTFFGKGVALTDLPPTVFLAMVGVVAVAALIGGSYPAFVLARFQPARVLSGLTPTSPGGVFVRRGLVVFQIAVGTVLLAATLLVSLQLASARERDLGFEGEQVAVLDLTTKALADQREALKQAMLAVPGVVRASVTSGTPGGTRGGTLLSPPGTEDQPDDDLFVDMLEVDADFQTALGLELIAGVWFREGSQVKATILNETAVRELGMASTDLSEAIGQRLGEHEVVGVVRDFHLTDLRQEIRPLQMLPVPASVATTALVVKIEASQVQPVLDAMAIAWAGTAPEYAFAPTFLDDQFANQLRADRQFGQLIGLLGIVAVVLASFGLLGLAAHAAESRTKEFGIRKVLGASVASLVLRLSREFVVLALLALAVAAPVVVILGRRWLEGFAYPATVSPVLFVVLCVGVLALTLATVGTHAVRVALADPVQSLRSE
ncbi:MAG: ABC transporter permease [Bacteroidota bacterium]